MNATILSRNCTIQIGTKYRTLIWKYINQLYSVLKIEKMTAEQNKQIVIAYTTEVLGDKNLAVIDRYIANDYIQHDPFVGNGKQALKDMLSATITGLPKSKFEYARIAADGDLVFLHFQVPFNGKQYAWVDIFRLEKGMIVEHWDVMQEITQSALHHNPMV
jgi:predicted SnoaL-like aldol condensation-catalyzing enzyme